MENVLRKIVEVVVRLCAYIPLGAASISFIASLTMLFKQTAVWVKDGKWHLPRLFEAVNMDFLSLLMDDKVSGFRLPLIKLAAKTATMPLPVFLLIAGSVSLCIGLVLLHFAQAIKDAGNR